MIDPSAAEAAELMERFYASADHERLRPYLNPEPHRLYLWDRLSNDATGTPPLTASEVAARIAAALEANKAAEAAHALAVDEWDAADRVIAERTERGECVPADELRKHADRRPRPLCLWADCPSWAGARADVWDLEMIAAEAESGADEVTLARMIDGLRPETVPGCPMPRNGGQACGAVVPGRVRQGRFEPSHGTRDWETPTPWPGFGFCSNACRTAYGKERRKALSTLRDWIITEAATLAREIADLSADLDRERFLRADAERRADDLAAALAAQNVRPSAEPASA